MLTVSTKKNAPQKMQNPSESGAVSFYIFFSVAMFSSNLLDDEKGGKNDS